MLEIIKNRKQFVLISVLLCLVTVFAMVQYKKAKELSYQRDLEYSRVFSELTQYVDDLEITLLKGQIVSTPLQMAKLSSDLYGQASAAKANLALLPLKGKNLERTSEFLSQVGEYASCISKKMLHGKALSQKEISTMQQLCKYAGKLKKGLDRMLLEINDGRISFSDNVLPEIYGGGITAMAKELEQLEEEFHNYPSLIYDGPFSQHLSLKEAVFVKGKSQITQNQAKKRAAELLGDEKTEVAEIGGKLPSYSIKNKNGVAEYTKQGGVLLLLMKDRQAGAENISVDNAKKRAANFLEENGFSDMRESYYEKTDGSIVINYAYQQDGYTVFSDLVKVKVALDNGEITGFESRGYIMNHTYRIIPEQVITMEDAFKNINAELHILDTALAVIPTEDGKEANCYQIKGIVSDKHFLIYVNTQTGETEDVQILLESDNGTLAV